MSIKALQDYTFYAKYARHLPEKKRRENWKEAVHRVFDMHRTKYAQQIENNPELTKLIDEAEHMVLRKKVIGSQRALQFGGKGILDKNERIYNCSSGHIDRPRAFQEAMFLLLCFAPETKIKTNSGIKQICDLTTEDEILSFDEQTNTYEYIKPSLVIETPSMDKNKIEIEMENGHVFRCTEDHKFLTTNRGWVEAKDLTPDDDIRNFTENTH